MTLETESMVHDSYKRAHTLSRSRYKRKRYSVSGRPSKRHKIVLRKKSKSGMVNLPLRRCTLRSSLCSPVQCTGQADEGIAAIPRCHSDTGPEVVHRIYFPSIPANIHSALKKSVTNKTESVVPVKQENNGPHSPYYCNRKYSEILSSEMQDFSSQRVDNLHNAVNQCKSETKEETEPDKRIVRNSWGRTPFKKKLASPHSQIAPVVMPDVDHLSSKSEESSGSLSPCEDAVLAHVHPTINKCCTEHVSVSKDVLDAVSTNNILVYATTVKVGWGTEAIKNLHKTNNHSECEDDGLSDLAPDPCLLDAANTRKELSISPLNEDSETCPEACILDDQKRPVLDCSSSNCKQIQPFYRDSFFPQRDSDYMNTTTAYGEERPLDMRCNRVWQYRCRSKSSMDSCESLGSNEDRVECTTLHDVYLNLEDIPTLLRSSSALSGQFDVLRRDSIIVGLSESMTNTSTSSSDDSMRLEEASSDLGCTDTNPPSLGPVCNINLPPHKRVRHRDKRIRMHIVRRPRKILVLGDMMSGKSNLISAYCSDKFNETYVPTICRCMETDATVWGEKINLVVVDISGRDDFEPLRRRAYHKMDAAIICYPVDSTDSFERVHSFWVPELRRFAPKAPFVVVGTKRDIRDEARDRLEEQKMLKGEEEELKMAGRLSAEATFVKEFVSHDRGKRMSNNLGAAGFYECSSIYRDGTRKLFEGVTKVALQKSRRKKKTRNNHGDNMCNII